MCVASRLALLGLAAISLQVMFAKHPQLNAIARQPGYPPDISYEAGSSKADRPNQLPIPAKGCHIFLAMKEELSRWAEDLQHKATPQQVSLLSVNGQGHHILVGSLLRQQVLDLHPLDLVVASDRKYSTFIRPHHLRDGPEFWKVRSLPSCSTGTSKC